MSEPVSNRDNGRAPGGRFAKGNAGGPGNPGLKALASFRDALNAALSEADIADAIQLLRTVMKDVNQKTADRLIAAREILNRGVGLPTDATSERCLAILERGQMSQPSLGSDPVAAILASLKTAERQEQPQT